jgi:hypothetical protein
MHRLSTSWLGLFALNLACGAPAELDKDLFPVPGDTGYTDSAIGSAGSTNVTGNGGGPSAGGTGGASVGGGGSAGASSNVPPGNGGTSSMPPAGGAGGSNANGGCPADATTLFNRPAKAGGCADGTCHVPGVVKPDLVSPGVLGRLLNVASTCKGRPYIGPDDSFLIDKIAGQPPECAESMPFFQAQSLSAADEQCIIDWVHEVDGGGG